MRLSTTTIAGMAAACLSAAASGQGFEWSPNFCKPGLGSGSASALTVYNDGTGPQLYMAGGFSFVGAVGCQNLARWNGQQWSALPSSVLTTQGYATTMSIASGPGSLAAGLYLIGRDNQGTGTVQRWDGAWHTVPFLSTGRFDTPITSLVHDDGYGAALYVGVVGNSSPGLRRWNGQYAQTIASVPVWALASFDDGTGPALYAGGDFNEIGGITAHHIGRWTPEGWQSLGDGLGPDFGPSVSSMVVFNDGSGPALYVAGTFSTAGGIPVDGAAKWTAAGGWAVPPAGFPSWPTTLQTVREDGETVLYVAGEFQSAGGNPAHRIARWDGVTWSPLGDGVGTGGIKAIERFDPGTGPQIYAGGGFTTVNDTLTPAAGIARFNGNAWAPTVIGAAVTDEVRAFTFFDTGDGPSLYAAGHITSAGGAPAGSLIKWVGDAWQPIPGAPAGTIYALLPVTEPAGPALYVAGNFSEVGVAPASNIARWDGTTWTSLGSGLNGTVYALEMFDEGAGPVLFAGGSFTTAGGVTANRLAKWNGTAWSRVGANPSGINNNVFSLKAFQGAGPPSLYVGGAFTGISGSAFNYLARWNGSAWSTVGTGAPNYVRAMTVQGTGAGARLWIGGSYGLVSTDGLTRSDEGSFTGVDNGVFSLLVADDLTGEAVYIGGDFRADSSNHGLARIRGSGMATEPLGNTGIVYALAFVPDPCTPAIFVGGNFTTVNSTLSIGVAARTIPGPGPSFILQPASSVSRPEWNWDFYATAIGGEVRYQWYKGSEPLFDSARVIGAQTSHLQLLAVNRNDGGDYQVTATNDCGVTTSQVAELRILCPAEFNFDFVLNPDDLSDYINAYFDESDPFHSRCDMNGDGVVNPDDLSDYINAYFTPC